MKRLEDSFQDSKHTDPFETADRLVRDPSCMRTSGLTSFRGEARQLTVMH